MFFLFIQDNFYDWFISKEFVNNRTGDVFVGVASIKMADVTKPVPITDEATCEESGIMSQVAKSLENNVAIVKFIAIVNIFESLIYHNRGFG